MNAWEVKGQRLEPKKYPKRRFLITCNREWLEGKLERGGGVRKYGFVVIGQVSTYRGVQHRQKTIRRTNNSQQ